MYQRIIYIVLMASLSGCVIPIGSSCMDSQKHVSLDANHPSNNSKCDATDAAVYVIAATLKTMDGEDKNSSEKAKEAVKCSDMVGKSQKECVRKEKRLYDPLDEL